MKRFAIAIPTMVLVAVIAAWMLGKYHSEVPLQYRFLITIGGALISGALSLVMSQKNVDQVDKMPEKER